MKKACLLILLFLIGCGNSKANQTGTNQAASSGLDLNQILTVEGLPANRSIIAKGWLRPSIVEMPDGTILAVVFTRDPLTQGEIIGISRSQNLGLTWSDVTPLAPGRDPIAFHLSSGRVLILHSTLPNDSVAPGKFFITYSDDAATTWTTIEPERNLFGPEVETFLGLDWIVELAGDRVLGFASVVTTDKRYATYRLESLDHGLTWQNPAPLFKDTGEDSIIVRPDQKIIALSRVDGPSVDSRGGTSLDFQDFVDVGHPTDFMEIHESSDQGGTFSTGVQILPPGEVPARLLQLKDGRVLMSYGVRHWPRGAQAMISADGVTWKHDREYMLAWHSADANCGYPFSIQLSDGTILTSYYVRRTLALVDDFPADDLYSEVVHWTLPASGSE